ncbi:MAG: tail fiber domain-containing protein [Polyangiaceae bacterium]
MRNRWIHVSGCLGFFALLACCGGSTTTVLPGSDASTDDGGSGGGSDGGTKDGGAKDGGTKDGGNGTCTPACSEARLCCQQGSGGASECVNPSNDPQNCGACGAPCAGGTYCADGACKPIPCDIDGGACAASGQTCCGSSCCNTGDLCCQSEGPLPGVEPSCFTPTADQATCPQGCAPLCVSDRNQKHALAPVDEQKILESVSKMPITTWSYDSDKASVRHIGPMAQDFHAAFGVGATDRAYDPIDAHGVAFAAIKALNEKLDEQNVRIERLEDENREFRGVGGSRQTDVCR